MVITWFDAVDQWGTCSITQAAYLRLLMNPRVTGFEIAASEVLSGLSEPTSLDEHVFLVDDAPPAEPTISFSRLKGPKRSPTCTWWTSRHITTLFSPPWTDA